MPSDLIKEFIVGSSSGNMIPTGTERAMLLVCVPPIPARWDLNLFLVWVRISIHGVFIVMVLLFTREML